MTDLITEARELCERATLGKWHWEGELLLTDAEQFLVLKPYYDDDTDNVSTCVMPDDAAFIARSRTLIPELCDALEKAQAEIPRWIPVTERLPEERQHENGEPIEFNVIISGAKVPTTLCFDGAGWRDFWRDGGYGPAYAVTHWMELPAPPEEGE